jgi:amidase
LFAMKPTIGSVEMDGIWPISPSFDAVGAMAKSTVDLALMTELLLKPEERRKLPDGGFLPALTITFEGLGLGFLDPIEWHFPPRAQHPVESVTKQIVR